MRELGDDVPVAEAQRVEQVIGVRAVRGDDVAGSVLGSGYAGSSSATMCQRPDAAA